jgi:hypothetical protein
LLIPWAIAQAEGCQQALPALALPQLDSLLARLAPAGGEAGDEHDYGPPHERALAQALGLPAGATPWAAWEAADTAQPCAWITPCHWKAGADQIHMLPPEALALSEAESRALLALLAPWFAEDGITLHYAQPLRWLARGSAFAGLETAALDRVQGRDVRHWMPRGPHERLLQRLHSEVQMLLYTHAFNDARTARGQLPVNAIWVHGAGALVLPPTPASAAAPPQVDQTLRDAALRMDWTAWAAAWRALDSGPVARLAAQAARGAPVQLTLCGERAFLQWRSTPRSLGQKIQSIFRPQRFTSLREKL